MLIITFKDTDRYSNDPRHNRPLFITDTFDNQPMSRVMIDGGSVVNILLSKTLTYLGVYPSHLKPSMLVIQGFNQNEQHPFSSVSLKAKFGHKEDLTSFYIIDANTAYNSLIG